MSNDNFPEILDRLEKKINEIVTNTPYALYYRRKYLMNAFSEIKSAFSTENWGNVYDHPEHRTDVRQQISDYRKSIIDLTSSEYSHSYWKQHLQEFIDLLGSLEKEFEKNLGA